MTSILDKKYDILRASLSFPEVQDKEKLLDSFKSVVVELSKRKLTSILDAINSLEYKTNTLEEEVSRLKKILTTIRKYREDFTNLSEEYKAITSDELIDEFDSSKTKFYENRLHTIKEYLSNINRINLLNKTLTRHQDKLSSYKKKEEERKKINQKLEEGLLDYFLSFIKTNPLYKTQEYEDLDYELDKIIEQTKKRKEELENFEVAYDSLENQSLPLQKRDEYKSYLQDARSNYFLSVSLEYIYKLYKLIIIPLECFKDIYKKREEIKIIWEDRKSLQKELDITSNIDCLDDLEEFTNNQFNQIKKEKTAYDSCIELDKRINEINIEIINLKKKNETVEILSILNEFSIIDTYDYDEDKSTITVIPNEIVSSSVCDRINLSKVHEESKRVMEEVINGVLPHEEEIIPRKPELKSDIFTVDEVIFDDFDTKIVDDTSNNLKDTLVSENKPIENDIFVSDTIFPEEKIKQEEIKQDEEFFTMDEKEILSDNLEEESNNNIIENSSTIPIIESIGSVKPTSLYKDIENKVSGFDNIKLPTNGIISNSAEVFNSNNFLNNEEDT